MNIQKNREGDVPVYHVDVDESARSMSCVVVEGIADVTDQDPERLDPLWESVDPEALDLFVAHASESATECQVTFQYHGYTVEVVNNRHLRFIPTEETLAAAEV
jgi:hypothetical protein